MADYLISVRNLSHGQFGSEPGATRYLRVGDDPAPTPEHKIGKTLWVQEVMEEARGARDIARGDDAGEILVFVHGYNNAPEEVLARHRLLKTGLTATSVEGCLISFDWPSNDQALNYLEDRSDARKTAIKLVEDCIGLFVATRRNGCAHNVHLLAHSTGAYVIREGFDDADDRRGIAGHNWSVSQIALIAADVSSRSLSQHDSKSSSIYRHCVRLTNYQNPYDSVLKLSNIKRVGVAPRAGRVGLPGDAPAKAVNVNAGSHFQQLDEDPNLSGAWSHSWLFGDPVFCEDLAHTLAGDIDRHYIPTRRRSPDEGLVLAAAH